MPEGWKTLAAGQMQVAKFAVPERDGAKAEVFVSVFPSESGGTLANVNRWRRQIGLDPVDEEGLKPLVSPLGGRSRRAARRFEERRKGACSARSSRATAAGGFTSSWASTPAVTAEREAFVRFVQTAP